MRVEVIIPWRGGCPHRQAALDWILGCYETHHPRWSVTVSRQNAGPWCKARAVYAALQISGADVVIVADADLWHEDLAAAVDIVHAGAAGARWAIPHRGVCRLSEDGTAAYRFGVPLDECERAEKPYLGTEGGGFVVARPLELLNVPLDPRFTGWGQEDESWGMALWTLCGRPWRGKGPAAHLWHPPAERATRRVGSREGDRLRRRYANARTDQTRMRELVKEARECLQT